MASHPIFQFYAELDDYKPKIWRRFQVSDNITPARLCYIVQTLFEMRASHLMALEVPVGDGAVILRYEIRDEDYEEEDDYINPANNVKIKTLDAVRGTLHRIGFDPGDKLYFNYDFGDDWWVTLTLEKVFEDSALPGKELPRALDGAGYGIIEDCGGTGGLKEIAKAFKKKTGAAYDELCEWLGVDDLDLSAFDLDDMNFRLKKLPRIFAQAYEQELYPTQRSIDLIERKYKR
jgi:hypothetical protein